VRTPYVRDEDVARICRAAASLTRDPATLLPEVPRIALYLPGMEQSAPSERGEDKSAEAVSHVSRTRSTWLDGVCLRRDGEGVAREPRAVSFA
jgi:hypothetical protein